MDADEELAVNDALKLRMVSTLQEHKLASVETIHFNGLFRPQAHEAYRLAQCRLFRNGEGVHFTGGIHEQLSWPDTYTREDTSTPFQLPVRLFHYGYLQSVTTLKSKHERNLKLLQEAVTDNPNPDPWSLYHIASEYQRVGKYALAFEQVNQAIAASLGQRRLPPSLFTSSSMAVCWRWAASEKAGPALRRPSVSTRIMWTCICIRAAFLCIPTR